MRERTTWNRDEIAKRAAVSKTADPYAMNQDHLSQQPAADKYETGDPSTFGEDVAPNNWSVEYSGGQTKRNEVGFPEMRPETFSHAEKTASSEELLIKKSNLCVKIARLMLPKVADEVLEDQGLALMHLPDAELIGTYNRLASTKKAADQQEQDKDQAQQKQAQDQAQQDEQQAKQQKQAQDQAQQDKDQAQQKQAQAQQDQDKDQAQQKQAGEMPPQFKENAEKKKEEAAAKKDEDKDEGQQKQASADVIAAVAAMQKGDMKLAQASMAKAVQAAVAAELQKIACAAPVAQQQPMQQQADQQQLAQQMQQQVAQMAQQAVQQQQAQQQPMMADDQLIDQMLQQDDPMMMPMSEMDIEMEAPQMDMMATTLGEEDAMLRSLFANDDSEAQQQIEGQGQQKQAHAVRTASSRTVGTRPTAGVTRIGGAVSGGADNGIDKLSSLWATAPDVSEVFGLKR